MKPLDLAKASNAMTTPPPDASPSPTFEQVRARRKACGLTQTEAAQLLHTTCRTWQQWEAPRTSSTHRGMHAAFWELFMLKTKGLAA